MVILPRPWKPLLVVSATGAFSLFCWWQIRLLGDLRAHLWAFYSWFALAFLAYLATLWLIHDAERSRVLSGRCSARALGPPRRGEPSLGFRASLVPRWRSEHRGRSALQTSGSAYALPSTANLLPNVLALAIIFIGAVAFRLCLLGTTPTLSDDIYRYRWDGRVQRAGIDPYVYPPNAPQLAFLRDEPFTHINFPHLRTVYPPLTQLAFRLGAWIGSTVTAQKIVFMSAELLTVLSLLFILWRRGQSLLWVAAYAWHPLVILEVAGSGHNDALGIGMLWLGLAAWETRRWGGVAAAWAGAFLSKFLSVIFVPWWWCRKEGRGWLIAFLTLAAIPLAMHSRVAMNVVEGMVGVSAVRTSSNGFVFPLLALLIGHPTVAKVIVIGVWAAFLVWWGRRTADPIRYLLGGLTFAALASPALHPWYLLWIIPCFCFYRAPAIVALTATVVLAYTMWPSYLSGGPWAMPLWARLLEYGPVVLLGLWACYCRLHAARYQPLKDQSLNVRDLLRVPS